MTQRAAAARFDRSSEEGLGSPSATWRPRLPSSGGFQGRRCCRDPRGSRFSQGHILQACAGVWRSAHNSGSHRGEIFSSLDSNHLPSVYLQTHLQISNHTLMKIKPELLLRFCMLIDYLSTWKVISKGWLLAWICKCWSFTQALHSSIVHRSANQWGPFAAIQAEVLLPSLDPESRVSKDQGLDCGQKRCCKKERRDHLTCCFYQQRPSTWTLARCIWDNRAHIKRFREGREEECAFVGDILLWPHTPVHTPAP